MVVTVMVVLVLVLLFVERGAETRTYTLPSAPRPATCDSHYVRNLLGEMREAIGYNVVSDQARFLSTRKEISKRAARNAASTCIACGPLPDQDITSF